MFEGVIITIKLPMGEDKRKKHLKSIRDTFLEVEKTFNEMCINSDIIIEAVDKEGQKYLEA